MTSRKSVSFSEENNIIYNLHVWTFASREARKGVWSLYSLDNQRFKNRIKDVELKICYCLDSTFREKMYRERFSC